MAFMGELERDMKENWEGGGKQRDGRENSRA